MNIYLDKLKFLWYIITYVGVLTPTTFFITREINRKVIMFLQNIDVKEITVSYAALRRNGGITWQKPQHAPACRPRRALLAHAVYCLEYEESIFNWERYFATVRRAIFIPRSSKMSAIF